MTKIAICGDSWFCSDTDPQYAGGSFGEILAKRNSWELISLARGGCSNFAIALQIDKAIQLKPDYIVVGATTADRIELPIQNEKNLSIWERIKSNFKNETWGAIKAEVFQKNRGIGNVQYFPHPDLSSQHQFLNNPTIVSESMNNLCFAGAANHHYYKLTDNQKTALKHYMIELYDHGIKSQYDSWIISDACRRLIESKIPFIIFVESLFRGLYNNDIAWLSSKNKVVSNELSLYNLPQGVARYHYCHKTGGIIVAEFIENKLKGLV